MLKILVLLFLLLSFVVGALTVLGMSEDADGIAQMLSWHALLVVIGLASLNYVLRFGRWHVYFGVLKEPVTWGKAFVAYLAGFAFTVTPGKAGEAGRSLLLRPLGVPHSRTVGACVAERINDLAAVGLLAALAVAFQVQYNAVVYAGAAVFLAMLLVLRQKTLKDGAVRLLKRWGGRLSSRIGSAIDRSYNDILALLNLRVFLIGLAFGIAGWCCEGLGFWYLLDAIGSSVPWHLAIGIYMLSLLVGALSFLPGGLIGTELSLFALLVAQGVPQATALAVTLSVRLCTLGYSVVLGGLALLLVTIKQRRGTWPTGKPGRR